MASVIPALFGLLRDGYFEVPECRGFLTFEVDGFENRVIYIL
jgi:hypothetical protein